MVLYPPRKPIRVELEQEVFDALTEACQHGDEEIAERLFTIWSMLPTNRPWPIGPLTTEFCPPFSPERYARNQHSTVGSVEHGMNEDQEQKLIARVTHLEGFVSGMSRRVVYARGEAMAATFCLAEIVNILSGENRNEKFSILAALIRADAALDKERAASEPKTQEAIDHARLLLKSMQITVRK